MVQNRKKSKMLCIFSHQKILVTLTPTHTHTHTKNCTNPDQGLKQNSVFHYKIQKIPKFHYL